MLSACPEGPLQCEREKLRADSGRAAVFACKLKGPMSLAKLAAYHCFHKLGAVWMRQFSTRYRVPVGQSQSLCAMLHACIRHFLPELSEDAQLEILAKRAAPMGADDECEWNDEALHQVVEAGDLDEVKNLAGAEKTHKAVASAMRSEFVAIRETIRASRSGGAAASTQAKKKARGAAASSSTRRYPMAPLAQELLPEAFLRGTSEQHDCRHSGIRPLAFGTIFGRSAVS